MEGKRDERNYVHGVFGRKEKKKKGDIKTQKQIHVLGLINIRAPPIV
jgi:hypothetical protein